VDGLAAAVAARDVRRAAAPPFGIMGAT